MARFFIGLTKALAWVMLGVLIVLTILSPAWAARPEDAKPPARTPVPALAPASASPAPTASRIEDTATPSPTPSPTPEPTPVAYTISMVGDCTLASYPEIRGWGSAFENVVNGDWTYPFSNTADIFAADDLTIVNLECSISDQAAWSGSTFSFLAPAQAVEILRQGGVEAATMANNHALDFGRGIYDDTAANLDSAGIAHCGDGESVLYTTQSGLSVGILAVYSNHMPSPDAVAEKVRALKEEGAEVVVVTAHWGNEASYYQNDNQVQVAHAAIDAGADIVAGHGPHRLEPCEEYNGGVIFYSLGNFVFGGNTAPSDMDSVIAQAIFVRNDDGTVALQEARAIPCSISSQADINDYRPTPLTPGTEEYDRAMSKVDGTWTGANSVIDYSFMHPEE